MCDHFEMELSECVSSCLIESCYSLGGFDLMVASQQTKILIGNDQS